MQVQLAGKKSLQANPVAASDGVTVSLLGTFAAGRGGPSLQIKSKASKKEAGPIPAPDRLTISLFGTFAVRHGGRSLQIKSKKAQGLLGYLLLSSSLRESRERLSGLFWSESTEEKARASLRQTLHQLHETFEETGFAGFQLGRDDAGLLEENLEVDVWSVLEQAANHQVHPLLLDRKRLPDSLLSGQEDLDPSFRGWLLVQRQSLQEQLERHFEGVLGTAGHHPASVKQVATALLNLDPTNEQACRCLMQTRAQEGDVAGALRIYKTLWDTLDEEYGMETAAATQQLVAEIKQGKFELSTTGPSSVAPAPTTVREIPQNFAIPDPELASKADLAKPASKIALVVEAFRINGIGEDKLHLVQGFRHRLIASLVRFREWNVTDGSGQPKGPDAASDVYARYDVEGTAYQTGEVICLILTLRESDANVYAWSETFELKLENWFEAQQRVVRRIASSLNVQLSTERLNRFSAKPDVSLDVYDGWLRGQAMWLTFSPETWNRATQIFTAMIERAPNFSPSYSSLVQTNNTVHIVHPGVFRDPDKAKTTLDLARTAVQLDPLDSRAQLCLGWSYSMSKQYTQAEVHMDLARELNPNDSWTLMSAALFNAFTGQFDRALELSNESLGVTLAPSRLLWGYQVSVLFLCGNYEGAIAAADRAEDIIKTLPAWRAAALHYLGRQDEAASDARRFIDGIRARWFGATPAADGAIGRWLLHLYPISERENWQHLRDGVVGAGVPVVGIEHHGW